jgi:predicted dehydrogenase
MRIPIAIVGLNFGSRIVELLGGVKPLFQIAAVCDLDPAKAKKVAAELGVRAYGDLDSLLSDADIPLIGLFTGPAGRAELLGKIIRAGKDVITTKPFEVDPRAASAVLMEAKRLGRVIHLNSPSPLLSPDLAQIVRWRDEYNLGRPVGARAEAWASYQEEADGGWYDDPVRCPLAPVFRLGIYLINDLIHLFGSIEAVQVFHSKIRTGRPTPDNGQLSLRFRNGALGNVYSSFCINDGQAYRNTLELNFERGTISRNAPPSLWTLEKHDVCDLMLVAHTEGRAIVRHKRALELSGTYQWRSLHRAITGEKLEDIPHATTPEQIVNGLEVIAAMSRAESSGRTEDVE